MKIILDESDRSKLLEVLAMASGRYHVLAGYAQDQGDEYRFRFYNHKKQFCDELSDQILNIIGRCEK